MARRLGRSQAQRTAVGAVVASSGGPRRPGAKERAKVMGASERRKGMRIEHEIVNRHREIGIHAERYPLSGSTRFRGSGHDIDIYALGRDDAPLVSEVKGRKSGAGFTTLERWLDDYDALFLRRDGQEPLVVVPWRIWVRLLHGTQKIRHEAPTPGGAEESAEGAAAEE